MILKNREGQVRLIWHLFLLVVPFLLAAFLLRYIPVRIQARILIENGVPESTALARARYLFLEDPIGASMIGIVQGLMWYVLVCFLVRSIEKQPCVLRSFGLDLKIKGLLLMVYGFLLGLIMFFGNFAVNSIFDQSPIAWSPTQLGILPILLVSLDLLVNGFGEETAFRAHWQRLLVDRHGLWLGITLASTSFVLLHLLIAQLTVIAVLAGILLACVFGILYMRTESIFLVGALHTTLNLAPRLLGSWPSDLSLLIVNGLVLVIVVILYRRDLFITRA